MNTRRYNEFSISAWPINRRTLFHKLKGALGPGSAGASPYRSWRALHHGFKIKLEHQFTYAHFSSEKRIYNVKEAILAKVVRLKRQPANCVAVRLESDEFQAASVIVSTGLNCEQTLTKRSDCSIDVTCKGDPAAKVGDLVPVIIARDTVPQGSTTERRLSSLDQAAPS